MENLEVKSRNYTPGSMSWAAGFGGPRGNVGYMMNADFGKAKSIIKKLISDGRSIESADMGLDGDWAENSMTVWNGGKFFEYNRHGGSCWAEPILIVNYADGNSETYSVWTKG